MSVAVNSVSPGNSPTNRETLAPKFNSRERWRDQTLALLRNHGFNGTGNWSDDKLLSTGRPRLVQTPGLNFMGSYGRKTVAGQDAEGRGLPGVWNSQPNLFRQSFEGGRKRA